MIAYKFPEEKQYALRYVKKLDDSKAAAILDSGEVNSKEQAEYLSRFFWRMVDRSVEGDDQDVDSLQVESNEFWNEKLMYSIAGYLERAGYEEVWERVSYEQ